MWNLRCGLLLLLSACASTAPEVSELNQKAAGAEAGICQYPAGVATNLDAETSGCNAGPAGQSCALSNGATVNADGSVTGGTKSCTSLCAASQYELSCRSAGPFGPIPAPMATLGCKIIAGPTPSNALFYCCPCAG
jgi:hypothetical protein